MKAQTLLLPLVMLAANNAFAASSELRGDCDARVRVAVAAASTDAESNDEALGFKLDQKALDEVVIFNVKSTYEGDEGRGHTISIAEVKNGTFKGAVKVTATRGGCFLNKISLHE